MISNCSTTFLSLRFPHRWLSRWHLSPISSLWLRFEEWRHWPREYSPLEAPLRPAAFQAVNDGHALIMGRKTWDSIAKLLPGRTTIVISRTMSLPMNGDGGTGPLVVRTLEEAVAQTPAGQFPMVVGGAEIYRLALPHCRQLWLTRVEQKSLATRSFPNGRIQAGSVSSRLHILLAIVMNSQPPLKNGFANSRLCRRPW